MIEKLRRQYSIDEVKQHDTPEDLWMIIYNNVYNVTDFAKDHPGGVEVLYDCGGVDATEAFDDVAHSDDAVAMLEPYMIGEVVTSQRVAHKNCRTTFPEVPSHKNPSGQIPLPSSSWFQTFVYVLLVMLALSTIMIYVAIQKVKWSSYSHRLSVLP
jgi:cytochrome b involved in lipid metabolism